MSVIFSWYFGIYGAYRIMAVLKVETDIIASILVSLIGRYYDTHGDQKEIQINSFIDDL
jgi:hypothetical protein